MSSLASIRALIQDRLDAVDALIDEQLSSSIPLIKDLSRHLIYSGGKRLRPMLTLLVAQAYGCQDDHDIILSTAIELVHAATLLHDDIVDNSQMRRGQQTANAIWDNAASVLVGDFLYSRSFQLMVKTHHLDVLKMLADATNLISEGEVLQLLARHNADTNENDYLNVLRYKTGTLFAAACQIGGLLAERPEQEIKVLQEFGENLGVAFQLVDDALDYCADEKVLGKELGDDLAEGKVTLPALHALQHAADQDRTMIKTAIMEGDRHAMPAILEVVKKCGGLDYTYQRAREFSELARECLQILPNTPYKEALIKLTALVIDRST